MTRCRRSRRSDGVQLEIRDLQAALAALPPEQRAVVLLVGLEQLDLCRGERCARHTDRYGDVAALPRPRAAARDAHRRPARAEPQGREMKLTEERPPLPTWTTGSIPSAGARSRPSSRSRPRRRARRRPIASRTRRCARSTIRCSASRCRSGCATSTRPGVRRGSRSRPAGSSRGGARLARARVRSGTAPPRAPRSRGRPRSRTRCTRRRCATRSRSAPPSRSTSSTGFRSGWARSSSAPLLTNEGYELVGGRLLPGESGAVAQFMYQDAKGKRLTLYVSRLAAENRDTAFRFSQEEKVAVFYWIDGRFGYALSGELPKPRAARGRDLGVSPAESVVPQGASAACRCTNRLGLATLGRKGPGQIPDQNTNTLVSCSRSRP